MPHRFDSQAPRLPGGGGETKSQKDPTWENRFCCNVFIMLLKCYKGGAHNHISGVPKVSCLASWGPKKPRKPQPPMQAFTLQKRPKKQTSCSSTQIWRPGTTEKSNQGPKEKTKTYNKFICIVFLQVLGSLSEKLKG